MANTIEELNGRRYFDYIVIGCGGIDSGALYWLSKRAGGNVLGLERFKLGHSNGGSHDVSRMIRVVYSVDEYLRLIPEAYNTGLSVLNLEMFTLPRDLDVHVYVFSSDASWEEIASESGYQLLYKPGSLNLADSREGIDVLDKYACKMTAAGIPFERLNNKQIMERFPQVGR
ncbi:sarcosine oxidase [Elysia marginata]|uniref:Sarcosine oxidase n=1 Tax=Elysia marginata TaxID=1093978 RepID=A0AAV4G423_9GAST|nr:sarcosine oxidase [Elysia marginata]